MKTIKGNLIHLAKDGEFDVIVHGCNCFNTMGAGIALQVRLEFPEAYLADLATLRGDEKKLGTFSCATIKRFKRQFTVVNAYTQYRYGKDMQADYKAIEEVFKKIKVAYHNCKIGIPLIGAGLAGGDWNIISKIIEAELSNEDVTLVVLE